MRPSPYLGYNRDELGLYFNDRGAEQLAESQFHRAVWLIHTSQNSRFTWLNAFIVASNMWRQPSGRMKL